MRVVCLVALASCTVALPVPLDPSPITKGAGKRPYEKAGVPLDGFTCGEKYQAAVTARALVGVALQLLRTALRVLIIERRAVEVGAEPSRGRELLIADLERGFRVSRPRWRVHGRCWGWRGFGMRVLAHSMSCASMNARPNSVFGCAP
ncbi:MAG TPA: hypothetical protein VH143_10960 [Kofleriaceae bacterium]|jgi:hypothetical protein|nr:hypothetical protein [Kofleriaceae bacterium]